jgi:hypothetical protein
VDDEGTVSGELAEPFDVILGEELRRAAIAREAEALKDAIEHAEQENKRAHTNQSRFCWAPRPPLLIGAMVGVRTFWCARVDSNHHEP